MKKITFLLLFSLGISSCSMLNNQIKLVKTDFFKSKKTNTISDNTTSDINNSKVILSNQELQTEALTFESDQVSLSNEILFKKDPNSVNIKLESKCDKILLRTGQEIEAKVIEIGTQEIKYKNCSNLEGPTISILKNDVFMITYSNNTKEVFKETPIKSTSQSNNNINSSEVTNNQYIARPKKSNGLAITSLILGILGFIPILGIIFGAIALSQIKQNPNLYNGKQMAIAGIVLSILWLIIFVSFLLLVFVL
jgi:hypothetical protein